MWGLPRLLSPIKINLNALKHRYKTDTNQVKVNVIGTKFKKRLKPISSQVTDDVEKSESAKKEPYVFNVKREDFATSYKPTKTVLDAWNSIKEKERLLAFLSIAGLSATLIVAIYKGDLQKKMPSIETCTTVESAHLVFIGTVFLSLALCCNIQMTRLRILDSLDLPFIFAKYIKLMKVLGIVTSITLVSWSLFTYQNYPLIHSVLSVLLLVAIQVLNICDHQIHKNTFHLNLTSPRRHFLKVYSDFALKVKATIFLILAGMYFFGDEIQQKKLEITARDESQLLALLQWMLITSFIFSICITT